MRISDWSSDVCASDLLCWRAGFANFQVMPLKTDSSNMSSYGLENYTWQVKTPADRILMALKMHGALSAAALGKRLGITGEAARQQLLRLAEQDLVTAASEARGVGRPLQLWDPTPAAPSRFPDTNASLRSEERRAGKEGVRTCRYQW